MNDRMMKNELYKVQREIKMHGDTFSFYRETLDDYGESTGHETFVKMVSGLFHTSKGYISQSILDATDIHTKGQPKLLTTYEEQEEIQNGDYFVLNNNKYKVIEKNNIQEYNIVCDISLELMLDGNN